jgi:hypothetical protein
MSLSESYVWGSNKCQLFSKSGVPLMLQYDKLVCNHGTLTVRLSNVDVFNKITCLVKKEKKSALKGADLNYLEQGG